MCFVPDPPLHEYHQQYFTPERTPDMEQLVRKRKYEINGNALRTWALLFLAAGVAGRGVIQTQLLGMAQANAQQLLAIMDSSETAMTLTSLSLALTALETCAVPILALFLVEGVQHTSDFKAYFLRVAGLALLTELPFNLAMSGKLFDLGSRNPVFGLVLSLALLAFYRYYSASKFQNTLIKLAVTVAAVLWCEMLKVDNGTPTVVIVAVMWAFRSKPLYRNFIGATAAIVCTVISPFYLLAPMGFLAVHFYDGEKSTTDRKVKYLAYPAMLLAAGVMGFVL